MKSEEITLGRNRDGERVTVEIRLEESQRAHMTIEHKEVSESLRLGITGLVYPRGWGEGWDIRSAGQIIGEVRGLVVGAELDQPKAGVRRLIDVWEAWHLNDMRAGCAHQRVVMETDLYGRRVPSLDRTPPCFESGYKYGSAWLYAPLPADVERDVRRWIETGVIDVVEERTA